MDKLAVLIPCYNEELTIGQVVDDFKKALPEAVIYVYDNNSTDNTSHIAKKHGAVVRSAPIQGKGSVVRQMFREVEADTYLMVDGDDTYPAESAKELLSKLDVYDMVLGDRLSGTYFNVNDRLFHGFGNKLVRVLVNVLYRGNIPDIMTGYRAFTREFVKSSNFRSEWFEIETEMSIWSLKKHFKIGSIPIEYRDRPDGSVSKLNTFKDGVKVLRTILVMKFRRY